MFGNGIGLAMYIANYFCSYQYLRQFQGARRDLDKLNRIRAQERREIK